MFLKKSFCCTFAFCFHLCGGKKVHKIVSNSPNSIVRGGGQKAVIVVQKGSEYTEVSEW